MLEFIINNPHFLIVVIIGILCITICSINLIKIKGFIFLEYVFFFFFSLSSSVQSVFNFERAFLSNLIFALFFTYDFYFFFSFCKEIFHEKIRSYSKIFLYLSGIILFIYLFNFPYPDKLLQLLTSLNSIFILILGIPVFYSFYKDTHNKIIIKEYQFWILSGFVINSIASFVSSTIMLSITKEKNNILSLLLYLTMYLSWIIKYFMILKSNLCLVKNTKYGG